jgi:hypothetical protein
MYTITRRGRVRCSHTTTFAIEGLVDCVNDLGEVTTTICICFSASSN